MGNAIVCGSFTDRKVCRVAGCDRTRPRWALICPQCWKLVPQAYRDRLRWADRGSPEQKLAAVAIIKWFSAGQEELDI